MKSLLLAGALMFAIPTFASPFSGDDPFVESSKSKAVAQVDAVDHVLTLDNGALVAIDGKPLRHLTMRDFLLEKFIPHAHAEDAQPAAENPPVTVPNVKEPASLEEAVQYLPVLIELATNGQWLFFGALLAVVLTFLIRQFVLPKLGLNTRVLPLVSAILGGASAWCIAYLAGATPLAAALTLLSGPVGSLLWDAVLKYVFNSVAPPPDSVKV